VIVVKDLRNNTHIVGIPKENVLPSQNIDYYAEDAMYDFLLEKYAESKLPFDAKIIFYLTKSPCIRCTGNIINSINFVCQNIGYNCYFSFVFREYYVIGSSGGNVAQNQMWGAPWDAQAAYNEIERSTNGLVTIRHTAQTKGGPEIDRSPMMRPVWHRKGS
jgi:hypothetical protein